MKKVTVIAVGKLKKEFRDAADEYAKRLSRFCDFSLTEIADSSLPDAVRRESAEILKRADGYKILCDVGGEQMSSEKFAAFIERRFTEGAANITFIIGGSEGVSSEVRAAADKRISFGAFTYPHQLMRVILLEQIYRAFTITAGLPYHK